MANGTDITVLVFATEDCRGRVLGAVHPRADDVFSRGASLYVPG
ncbi:MULTISPECIES: hypothetical protein [Streptomyces]|nr:hypothetical protein [Streptomyces sp. NRRL F-2890]